MEKQREDKQSSLQLQMQLKDAANDMERMALENQSLKHQVNERAAALEEVLKEHEKLKQRSQQLDASITKQQRSFQAKAHECESLSRQCSDLVVKVEEMHEQSLSAKQSCSSSQLEQDALKKELRALRHQLEDTARDRDAASMLHEEASREKQRLDERLTSMARHLDGLETDSSVLHKEKMEIAEYAKKLEKDIAKGLKALQQQERDIDQLTSIKGELQDCARDLKERLFTMENQNTRLCQEMNEHKEKHEQDKTKMKRMERQLHTDVDIIDKLKMQASSLKVSF